MSADLNDQSENVRQLLINKLHDWKDGVSPVWNSTWPVFDRLIIRNHEMIAVYEELAERGITGTRLWILLEQLIFAASFGTEEKHARLRSDYRELNGLNEAISEASSRLATMIERRSELLNRSGHFYCERRVSLTELIDEAGKKNRHYQSFLKNEISRLNTYDLKYWPAVEDILRVMGLEDVTTEFADDATEAIINARRPSLTDYFRVLFDRINEQKKGLAGYSLPRGFRLSDESLATICNITRDLNPEDMVDAGYVKRTRHRLKEQGVVTGW
ncbi:hypothetical protein [Rahnella inusitata]|uniref:hypothetical protein n=1 Tax=Rahnella inusitata TaxID=58169 RepID=UPI0039B0234E